MVKGFALACVLAGLAATAPCAYAQTPTGSLSGTVTDATGASVAGARVSLVNAGTRQARDQTTSEQGLFTAAALTPGIYRLTIHAAGFKRTERDVVVEVAGGMEMEAILNAALAAGKPVVTANKTLLASKLADLGVLAQRTATPLYCEAAAAAALPILRHLSHRADEVDSLSGILNGTCNFVMTRMEQAELSLEKAVAEAQALGLAEGDPEADLSGMDAAAKLSILAYRAFGVWVHPNGFLVRGIREIGPADCDLAESMGCRIRLIARAARVNGALDMAVEPLLVPAWHLLASVEEEYNAVYLRCASSGDLSLFGKGAGDIVRDHLGRRRQQRRHQRGKSATCEVARASSASSTGMPSSMR